MDSGHVESLFLILVYTGVLMLVLALGEKIALNAYYNYPRFRKWFDKYSEQFDLEDNM